MPPWLQRGAPGLQPWRVLWWEHTERGWAPLLCRHRSHRSSEACEVGGVGPRGWPGPHGFWAVGHWGCVGSLWLTHHGGGHTLFIF